MSQAAEHLYEQVLVLRFQAGDQGAFTELVRRYHDRLRYYVRRLSVDESTVDDVLQEIWLKVFRGLPKLRQPRALSMWLYRIARNAALAEHRRQRAHVEFALQHEPQAPGAAPEHADFTPEDAGRIHAALERLPPHQRDVLLLRFLEALSYEDIADIVGTPVGTVRSRIHYAKCALRQAMRG
jgi:RNA polymerase sigma-70 factor (ECF subfamily)